MTERAPEITMEDVGRYRLRVAHWTPDRPTGKRPLVFFNGIGANLELAMGLGDMMPDREILTFDMPGIGESEPPLLPYLPWIWMLWACHGAALWPSNLLSNTALALNASSSARQQQA